MEEQRSQQGRRTLTRFRVGRIGNGHLSLVEPSGRAGEFSGLSSASRVWARKRTRVKQVMGSATSVLTHQITRWVYAALASLAGRRRLGKGVAREGRRTPLRPAAAGLSRRRKPRNVI